MILVIDNYDSFTFNLVQYLGELGRTIKVFRNDALSVDQIPSYSPDGVVISPGPGRPEKSGIIVEVVRQLAGRIPILGVCLGHQAVGVAFSGVIVEAPTIMHGKTSEVHHDGRTIFEGLENPFSATRYHSLVVSRDGLPDCLEVTAETSDGVIMGLRHKQYLVEGVQFHPESILTVSGKRLLANFLALAEKAMNSVRLGEYVIPESIHGTQLARIVADKLPEIREAKRKLPAHSLQMAMERAPSVRSLKKVFSNRGPAIVAEIKRASPSAGVIREELDPVQIGLEYEESGASAISVLTEVTHFRGGLENLARLRWSTRLPLLRKDFIVDDYQLLESRWTGADAVLLITALLDQRRLRSLRESAESLGMEALIEVHDEDELSRALDAGATLIGVNSRDLRTFEVSLGVPLSLAGRIPSESVAVAESGIRSARDIGALWDAGYRGFLIGELFMRAESPGDALANLKQSWRGGGS